MTRPGQCGIPNRASGARPLQPRFKLWLSTADDSSPFGRGRWLLLRAIHSEGTLRKAAATLDISYRKAWGDLRRAERSLGVKLVRPRRGGPTGGATGLTDEGLRLVEAYGRFEAKVGAAVEQAFRSSFEETPP